MGNQNGGIELNQNNAGDEIIKAISSGIDKLEKGMKKVIDPKKKKVITSKGILLSSLFGFVVGSIGFKMALSSIGFQSGKIIQGSTASAMMNSLAVASSGGNVSINTVSLLSNSVGTAVLSMLQLRCSIVGGFIGAGSYVLLKFLEL